LCIFIYIHLQKMNGRENKKKKMLNLRHLIPALPYLIGSLFLLLWGIVCNMWSKIFTTYHQYESATCWTTHTLYECLIKLDKLSFCQNSIDGHWMKTSFFGSNKINKFFFSHFKLWKWFQETVRNDACVPWCSLFQK